LAEKRIVLDHHSTPPKKKKKKMRFRYLCTEMADSGAACRYNEV
jgi:hypothetical protein